VRLITEALKNGLERGHLTLARDGIEALEFLRRQGKFRGAHRPDLIVLDLNLPGRHGHEVLEEIKRDPDLKRIPVIILTSSTNEADIRKSYELSANCYVTKEADFHKFVENVRSIRAFWLDVASLPPGE
jgi:chemotaxis family two-component system response regulator Rcp1